MTATVDTTSATRETAAARMSFTTDRATLVDALTTVGLAVSKRPVLPMLGGALLRACDRHLTISATDYNTTVTVRVPGTVQTPGTLLIDHSEVTKLLGALTKGTRKRDADALAVTVRTLADGTPVVDLAGYTMPVTAYPTDDYPPSPVAAPTLAQVDRETLTHELTRVLVAVSTDSGLPMLTGVNLDITPGALTMAGTDRYRLAVAPLPAVSTARGAESVSALVPGQLVAAAVKRFTGDRVRIGLDDVASPSVVSLTCDDITVSVRTIDGVYPPYRQLIPADAAVTVQTDRAGLLAATQRAAAVLSAKRQDAKHVVVTFTSASVSVAPVLEDHAEAVAAPEQAAAVVGITGAERFWFDAAYLADALDCFTGDTITLHTQGNVNRPVLITDSTAFRHLIMPVRAPKA